MSGRAEAWFTVKRPAPMVTANANAILNDIMHSSFTLTAKAPVIPREGRLTRRFTDALLTACFNQQVSAAPARPAPSAPRVKMLEIK